MRSGTKQRKASYRLAEAWQNNAWRGQGYATPGEGTAVLGSAARCFAKAWHGGAARGQATAVVGTAERNMAAGR